MTEIAKQRLRFVSRYVLAALLIPPSLAIGAGGLALYLWRRLRGTHATFGARPEPKPLEEGRR